MHSNCCCAFVHRKPQQEGTEVAVTPLPATAPPNSYTNFAFDGATAESNRENMPVSASSGTSNDDDYVNLKQLSTPSVHAAVADAVAGTDNGDRMYQPTDEYERLSRITTATNLHMKHRAETSPNPHHVPVLIA